MMIGGPAGGSYPVRHASFRLIPVRGSAGTITATTDRAGRFAVTAAPGVYRVVMARHAPMSDGRPLPTMPHLVTVRSGSTHHVRLVISIR